MIRAFFGSTSEQALRNYDIDCDGQINPQPKARESTDTIFRPTALTHLPAMQYRCFMPRRKSSLPAIAGEAVNESSS